VIYDAKCRRKCQRASITGRFIFDCPVKTGTMEFGEWENVHIRLNCEDWYNEVQYKTRTEERPDLGDE
jgi:hypothetical protein